jgi:hypothetical protein
MKNKILTEEEILIRARESHKAHQKKLNKPKWLLAKNPTMMGQFADIYAEQREARG